MSGVAVVTGAGNGIGRSIAERLDLDGFMVLAVDRDGPALSDLTRARPSVRTLVADLTGPGTMPEIRAAAERLGTLTAWVNNAALVELGALHEADDAHLDAVLGVNLRAVLTGTREALRAFLAAGTAGSIVNISSIHARGGFPGYAVYDTCKGGVEALTRYVCVEYGHLGIRCNAVAPGAVLTPAAVRLSERTPDPAAAFAATRALSPMRRMSDTAEVAAAVAFLLQPGSVGVNGHVLAVDNGMAAQAASFEPESGRLKLSDVKCQADR